MRVLFIGGTGIISSACTALAVERGIELTLLTRGKRELPHGVRGLNEDIHSPALAAKLENDEFDAVVDWIAFTPDEVERDIRLFRGRTRQFIFISSASVYQKPQTHYLMTESTPLANPHWDYSRNKIACEERLMTAYREEGFPITIVRPSLTYGETLVPLVMNSWAEMSYTAVDRMIRGQKVVVPGDGTSLWVITHNSDFAKGFVGLLGHKQAIGHAFHITSDEVLTWDQEQRDLAGECLFRFVFRSLYGMHAFNGDPHPGNYLFHGDGRITFVDFGLVKHFTDTEITTFIGMVRAAAYDHDPTGFRRILERAGMLRPGAPAGDDEVGEYFSQFYESVRTDQTVTWSTEYSRRIVRHTFDRTSPIAQYATVPRAFVFIQRINLGLYALLGDLRATGNFRRMAEELWPFALGAPSTPLGEAEAAWLRVRGA